MRRSVWLMLCFPQSQAKSACQLKFTHGGHFACSVFMYTNAETLYCTCTHAHSIPTCCSSLDGLFRGADLDRGPTSARPTPFLLALLGFN